MFILLWWGDGGGRAGRRSEGDVVWGGHLMSWGIGLAWRAARHGSLSWFALCRGGEGVYTTHTAIKTPLCHTFIKKLENDCDTFFKWEGILLAGQNNNPGSI